MTFDSPDFATESIRIGVVLAASGVALAPLAAALIAGMTDERPRFFARWGFSHAALVLLAALVSWPVWGLVFGAVMPDGGMFANLCASLCVTATACGAAAVVANRVSPEGMAALGFPTFTDFPKWRGVVAGPLAYALVLPAIVGLERIMPPILEVLEISAPEARLVDGILALAGMELVATIVLVVAIGPFLEEVLFRGFLQPLLVQNFSEKGGVAITAFLFAILHPIDAFLPLFALAVLLGWLRVKSQGLAAPLVVHVINNGLVLLIAFQFPEARELVQ